MSCKKKKKPINANGGSLLETPTVGYCTVHISDKSTSVCWDNCERTGALQKKWERQWAERERDNAQRESVSAPNTVTVMHQELAPCLHHSSSNGLFFTWTHTPLCVCVNKSPDSSALLLYHENIQRLQSERRKDQHSCLSPRGYVSSCYFFPRSRPIGGCCIDCRTLKTIPSANNFVVVCVFVWLLTESRKNYKTDFLETWWRRGEGAKEDTINCVADLIKGRIQFFPPLSVLLKDDGGALTTSKDIRHDISWPWLCLTVFFKIHELFPGKSIKINPPPYLDPHHNLMLLFLDPYCILIPRCLESRL